ncbi:MAG: 3-dehydroquinate synthase, partial [Polyangiaceae bacterium]|nr:3-dehydroquinate synthase [Polyangiaceae bacterium]
GSGKSTVGPLLAQRLGVPFFDTDQIIEARVNKKVNEFWRSDGSDAFRAIEREVALEVLADASPKVIAFGGGTVTLRDVRRKAIDTAYVVTLGAATSVLLGRVGDPSTRPLLASGDAFQRLEDLASDRADAYAECHASIDTEGFTPDELVDRISSHLDAEQVIVPLGRSTYGVENITKQKTRLVDRIAELAPSSIVIVTDSNVERLYGKDLRRVLSPLAIASTQVTLAPGEMHKNIQSAQLIWDAALGAGVDRDTLLLAFGGGTVGDLTGFAASTLLRGVRTLQVPTTLLAMVDSSVGGKTGLDHPAGKNLVGTFFQPSSVLIDFDRLKTLPDRDYRGGLAEIVKVALVSSSVDFERLEVLAPKLRTRDAEAIREVVFRAITTKARFVRDDERDNGERVLLNFGHTLGHAVEAAGGFRTWLHGEAVALGMLGELQMSVRLGRTPKEVLQRVRFLLERFELPCDLPKESRPPVWAYIRADKKRVRERIRIPIVTGVGVCKVDELPLQTLRDHFFS